VKKLKGKKAKRKAKKRRRQKKRKKRNNIIMNRKKLTAIIISSAAAIILIAALILWAFVFRLPSPEPEVFEHDEEVVHETESDVAVLNEAHESFIDGTEINAEEENMIAVIIENHGDSRRQMNGLYSASLVFETEAEGGITRFLAFYPYQNTEKVGPVRSARPYFARWAEMFNTALAHAGASEMGFSAIYSSGRILDLDGLALEGGLEYFTRDYMYYAPHNLYANLEELRELMDERGWNKPVEEQFVKFGDIDENSLTNSDIEEAETIHIYYPYPNYFVRYDYDSENEKYLRFEGGEAHIDHLNGKQIETSNVVVMITNYYPTDEEGRLYMKTEGKGDMYLFRNGKVIPGTWKRISSSDKYKFYDENDTELKFNKGKTWISVINYQGGMQWE
jgi:hypothetical protein